jgi:hypothetical protein
VAEKKRTRSKEGGEKKREEKKEIKASQGTSAASKCQ